MIEADLTIDGYGVRCGCAGEEYRFARRTIKRLVEDGERLAKSLKWHSGKFAPNLCTKEVVRLHTTLMKEMEDK
jgi:hypothetical protein